MAPLDVSKILATAWLLGACGRIDFNPLGGGADATRDDAAADGTAVTCSPFGAVTPLGINAVENDGYPWPSSNGLELYFASYRPGGLGGSDLWVATRPDTASPFGAPVALAAVNSATNDREPSLSQDGRTLFFTSEGRAGGPGSVDIWSATRPDLVSAFGPPAPVLELDTASADRTPAIAASGLKICFGSDRPGGAGGYDLWCATRSLTTASFGPPARVAELESSADDWSPWLAADERTILFASSRPGGAGMSDLWTSTRPDPGAAFGAPEPITELDTSSDELSPALSSDGLTIYFRSTRAGGAGGEDLWSAMRSCP
jgi:Tol biopolymer transport system component